MLNARRKSKSQTAGSLDNFQPVTAEGIEAKARASDFLKKHAKSKKAARDALIKMGMLTKSGNLPRRYGG